MNICPPKNKKCLAPLFSGQRFEDIQNGINLVKSRFGSTIPGRQEAYQIKYDALLPDYEKAIETTVSVGINYQGGNVAVNGSEQLTNLLVDQNGSSSFETMAGYTITANSYSYAAKQVFSSENASLNRQDWQNEGDVMLNGKGFEFTRNGEKIIIETARSNDDPSAFYVVVRKEMGNLYMESKSLITLSEPPSEEEMRERMTQLQSASFWGEVLDALVKGGISLLEEPIKYLSPFLLL